jgi:hypothetical protein
MQKRLRKAFIATLVLVLLPLDSGIQSADAGRGRRGRPAAKATSQKPAKAPAKKRARRAGRKNPVNKARSSLKSLAKKQNIGVPQAASQKLSRSTNSVRKLLEKRGNPHKGLRRNAVISRKRAIEYLKKTGWKSSQARRHISSFKGPITARIIRPGERYLRYGDKPKGSRAGGRFLTKSRFQKPRDAVNALHLRPYGNRALRRQEVVATKLTIVLEGGINKGGPSARQQLLPKRSAWRFGRNKEYATKK